MSTDLKEAPASSLEGDAGFRRHVSATTAAWEEDEDEEATSAGLKAAFARFDLNGNGLIEFEELTEVLEKLDPEAWTSDVVLQLWNAVDVDGDGVISLPEFADWLSKPPKVERRKSLSKDTEFSAEQMAQIAADFARFGEMAKLGTVQLEQIVEDSDLEDTLSRSTSYVAYGRLVEEQQFGDDRPWQVLGGRTYPGTLPAVSCQKGYKGRDSPQNQDNFSIACFENGYTMFCVFDGHGTDGHLVSTRTVQTVPYFLAKSSNFPDRMEDALKDAFMMAHSEMLRYGIENRVDAEGSGTTAVVVLVKGNTVWLAWAGDSRALIASRTGDRRVLIETSDHKPEVSSEKARIEACGGEVREVRYPNGFVNHRVYKKDGDQPGLCMTRSLADNSGKSCGVTAEPEVLRYDFDPGDKPFLMIASDGIWEFMQSSKTVRVFGKDFDRLGPEKMADKLVKHARKLWKENEGGDYCDDITCLLMALGE